MYHIFYIHPYVEGHLGGFQLLATKNMAILNIVDYGSLLHVGKYFEYMSRNDIAGSLGSSMSNFLSNAQTDL